jgi:hypothetical protein
MKLAKWRGNPIDGMNSCGIKMMDNTLRWFGIFEEKTFKECCINGNYKILEEISCEFECCVFYTFEVYGLFLCMSIWINYFWLNNKEARQWNSFLNYDMCKSVENNPEFIGMTNILYCTLCILTNYI